MTGESKGTLSRHLLLPTRDVGLRKTQGKVHSESSKMSYTKPFYHEAALTSLDYQGSANHTQLPMSFKQNSIMHSLQTAHCDQPSVTDTQFLACILPGCEDDSYL